MTSPSSPPSDAAPPGLTRVAFDAAPGDLLNRGNRRNPDVYRLECAGESLVVKDFAPRSRWVRATIGRWVTRREARAWQALAGHPLVPRFRGMIDALAFAVEYREGRRMSRKLAGKVPPDFADRLEQGVREMHARGVVHLDLRHRSNVLVGATGDPILIDFGSALVFEPGGWGARLVLPLFAWIDRRAARKWRRKLQGPASV